MIPGLWNVNAKLGQQFLIVNQTSLIHVDRQYINLSIFILNVLHEGWLDLREPWLIIQRAKILTVTNHAPSMGYENIRQIIGSHTCLHQLLIIRALCGVTDLNTRILLHKLLQDLIYRIISLLVGIRHDLKLAFQFLLLIGCLCRCFRLVCCSLGCCFCLWSLGRRCFL